jgi:hypothetical protein
MSGGNSGNGPARCSPQTLTHFERPRLGPSRKRRWCRGLEGLTSFVPRKSAASTWMGSPMHAASTELRRQRTSSVSGPPTKYPSTATGSGSRTAGSFTRWTCMGSRGRCPRSKRSRSQAPITHDSLAASRSAQSPARPPASARSAPALGKADAESETRARRQYERVRPAAGHQPGRPGLPRR